MSSSPGRQGEPSLLDAVDYPTSKDELLVRADAMHAPDALRAAICRLGPEIFPTRRDLIAAIEAIDLPETYRFDDEGRDSSS